MKLEGRAMGVVVIGGAEVWLTADGPLAGAQVFRRSQGGDAVLAAVGAARLGVEVALVTRVGRDAFGDWLLESWEAEHLHLDYARQVGGRNPVALHGATPEGRERIVYQDGAAIAGLEPGDIAAVPWELARLVYVPGSLQAVGAGARAVAVRAFEEARARGALTVYDPTLRADLWPEGTVRAARAAFDELLPLTDVLVIGAPYATGKLLLRPTAAHAAREARRRGLARAVVRYGTRSCLVVDRDQTVELEGPEPPEVRHAGVAAAAFNGALLAGLALGRSLADAAAAGLDAVALGLGGAGDVDALPWRDQLDRFRAERGEGPLAEG